MDASEFICQHCREITTGKAYRVTSEVDGEIILNMIVCEPCAVEARRLQLKIEQIDSSEGENIKRG